EALKLSHEWDSAWAMAECLECLALIAEAHHASEQAARLLAAAARLRASIGAPAHPVDRADHDRALERIQTALGAPSFDAAWTAGQAMTPDEVIAFATSVS